MVDDLTPSFARLPARREPEPDEIELPSDGNSLYFLQLVYRNTALPLHTRMRAAMAALKHEVPALLATAVVNEQSFAELLDRRIARLQEMENARLIEAQPEPAAVEVAPTPSINYRSLRRRI